MNLSKCTIINYNVNAADCAEVYLMRIAYTLLMISLYGSVHAKVARELKFNILLFCVNFLFFQIYIVGVL